MLLYCTTKNTGPSYASDPLSIVYLGTSVKKAEDAVGEKFAKYQKLERDFPHRKSLYCALPKDINWEMIQYYSADGWWYSIVMFEVE